MLLRKLPKDHADLERLFGIANNACFPAEENFTRVIPAANDFPERLLIHVIAEGFIISCVIEDPSSFDEFAVLKDNAPPSVFQICDDKAEGYGKRGHRFEAKGSYALRKEPLEKLCDENSG